MAEATIKVTTTLETRVIRPARLIDYIILSVLLWVLADVSNAAPVHADIAAAAHTFWTAAGVGVFVYGALSMWEDRCLARR